jgi:DNA polymerase-3 subunit epsilon
MDIDTAYALLSTHPDYRVLRRFVAPAQYGELAGTKPALAAIVDTETTGTEYGQDRIVELGLIVFEYDPDTGEVGRILKRLDALEDPGMPIPAQATAVHGITDAMVAGQRIDEAGVESVLESVDLVIAHNASFDRPFLEDRLPPFADLRWGCSLKQVDWQALGAGSAKLDYLAYRCGVFHEAHRARNDCEVLLHVLQHRYAPDQRTPLQSLLEAAAMKGFRLGALGAPFEMRGALRERGYRWDAERRLWSREVLGDEAARIEADWLHTLVYDGRACSIEVELLPATVRFSRRAGKVAIKALAARR